MYLRAIAIAIAIAITFLEIQKIFDQLFATLPGKFNRLNSDLTPLLLY